MKPTAALETVTPLAWISGRQARQRLGLTPTRLFKLVAMGAMRVQSLPGEPLKYSHEDVERLVSERQAAKGA